MNFERKMDVPQIPDIKNKELPKFDCSLATNDSVDFWNKVFESADSIKKFEEHALKPYYDDNGVKYRTGDTLESNATFYINGYMFKTDDLGRTILARASLKMADSGYTRKMDSMEVVGDGDQKESDQRGHLIGHQFGGSDGVENLVPMDAKLNQGDYKKMEMMLADAKREGCEVYVDVEPRYTGDSKRPDEFKVTYIIDGEKDISIFKNESEQ